MLWAFLACQVQTKPSIVIIVVDTLRADHVGVYGAPRPTTPNIDGFARSGMYFERAFSHSGWTLPAMASLWTGLYPNEHRVIRSPYSEEEFGSLPEERITLAESFTAAKYRTAAVTNNTFLAPVFGLHQGFEDYYYQGADNTEIRSAKDTTDVALKWWRETKGSKFLVVHYMEPHMDFNPPALSRGRFLPAEKTTVSVPFRSRDAFSITQEKNRDAAIIEQVLALYDEEILAVDVEVARLVTAIGKEDTLFVFTSDHGEEFWEHDGFEHGHHLKSGLTRVPLIVWGKDVPKNGVQSGLVSHVDVHRSLLHYANLPITKDTHGIDILSEKSDTNSFVISENTLYGDPMISIINNEHRLEINQKSKIAVLWSVDDKGMETTVVSENRQEISNQLFRQIQGVRGSLDVIEQIAGPQIPSQEVFQQLKLLGYINE